MEVEVGVEVERAWVLWEEEWWILWEGYWWKWGSWGAGEEGGEEGGEEEGEEEGGEEEEEFEEACMPLKNKPPLFSAGFRDGGRGGEEGGAPQEEGPVWSSEFC